MMYHISEFNKEFYRPGEVGKYLGVVQRTISRYCEQGKIQDILLDTGKRVIPKSEVVRILEEKGLIDYSLKGRKDIVYARVSTHKQATRGDLDRQVEKILAFAANKNPKDLFVVKEVASGLNDNRKELLKVIQLVLENKVDRIFISYKDRLTRFGFNYLETICKFNNTEIVIVSTEEKEKSIEEELAEDLIAIIHSFSGKLYGLRGKVKKAVNKELS